jgi:neutral ceramidase
MLGLNKKHLSAVVNGITQSILNAHADLQLNAPAPLYLAQGLLANASINRSPSSYLANPPAERAANEQWGGDTDHNMTLLRVSDGHGRDRAALSIFAVHCTSMHNTNRLVSSDNKGYASYRMEQHFNGNATVPGTGYFVAAFGQSNLGDVSPNILGAWCGGRVGGVECSNNRSLCDGFNENCVGVGPAGMVDDAGSTAIIGERQLAKALELWDTAASPAGRTITGGVKFAHTWVNMSGLAVDAKYTTTHVNASTCRPAVGFSFAAGTTDGPGAFNFYQGDNCSTCMPFWEHVRNLLKKPTPEQIACQGAKPILLDVGEIKPYPWVPLTLPLQVLEIGSLVMLVAPCEFTTMAGRRVREAVRQTYAAHGRDVVVVIAGLANAYSQYTATYEEYQYQRYEAASTLYGPHQLAAYTQEFVGLATALLTNTPVPVGVPHDDKSTVDFYLFPENVVDTHPEGVPYGTVLVQPPRAVAAGSTVNVTFQGANLRNEFMQGSSFMLAQRSSGTTGWVTVMTDGNWETKVHWKRENKTESVITCQWDIPAWMTPGTYRIVHQAFYKPDAKSETLQPYQGGSVPFQITAL